MFKCTSCNVFVCLVSDPDPVSLFNVPPSFPTNNVTISWQPPMNGSVDNYTLIYTDVHSAQSFDRTTSALMYSVLLDYGSKYKIEIVTNFKGLQGSAIDDVTVIGW